MVLFSQQMVSPLQEIWYTQKEISLVRQRGSRLYNTQGTYKKWDPLCITKGIPCVQYQGDSGGHISNMYVFTKKFWMCTNTDWTCEIYEIYKGWGVFCWFFLDFCLICFFVLPWNFGCVLKQTYHMRYMGLSPVSPMIVYTCFYIYMFIYIYICTHV